MLLLEHTCDIEENQALGTNGRKQMVTISSAVPCLILPMQAKAAVEHGYTVGRAYDAYFDLTTAVKVGQRLTWNGKQLMIGGLMAYNTAFAGHQQAACSEVIS